MMNNFRHDALEVAARIISPVMEDLRLEVMGLAPYRVFTYDDA